MINEIIGLRAAKIRFFEKKKRRERCVYDDGV